MGQEEAAHRMNGIRIRIETAVSITEWGPKSLFRGAADNATMGSKRFNTMPLSFGGELREYQFFTLEVPVFGRKMRMVSAQQKGRLSFGG